MLETEVMVRGFEAEAKALLGRWFLPLVDELTADMEAEIAILAGRLVRWWSAVVENPESNEARRQLGVLRQTARNIALTYQVRASSAAIRAWAEAVRILAEVGVAFLRAALR